MPVGKTMRHNWFVIKTIAAASPFYFFIMVFDAVRWRGMNFILWAFGVGYLMHTIEHGHDFRYARNRIIIMIALQGLSALYSGWAHRYVEIVFYARANQKMRLMLYEKARAMDLSCYDNPEYYNNFVLTVSESSNAVRRTMQLIDKMITGLIMAGAYGAFFLVNDAVSVLFVLGSFTARFLIGKAVSKINFKVLLAQTPFIKKREYIHRVFYLNDYAKELRLNKQVTRGLFKDFKEANDEILQTQKGVAKKRWLLNFCSAYVFNDLVFDGVYMTYLIFMTMVRRTMSFTTLFLLWGVTGEMRRGMVLLSELFPQAVENALYIDKIRGFLDYEKKIVSEKGLPVPAEIKEICFENVSFRYTENQEYILQNINLRINPYDKIALVGYNGAGKTTLIKLLMRLYDPESGSITLGGTDIRDFNPDEYRDLMGTIFQDFRIYAASVEQNIVMDLQNVDGDTLSKAVKLGGFAPRLSEMENGASTPLTTEFDETGTALSGGESQKLATARVFYKPSNLIILDEPSSALDPIAEYQMNRSMQRVAREKSVVFISHRLSTTKHADKIFMLDRGRIIEEGTHDELLGLEGKYAEMWQAQASKYV